MKDEPWKEWLTRMRPGQIHYALSIARADSSAVDEYIDDLHREIYYLRRMLNMGMTSTIKLICCPDPAHEDKNPSCLANLETETWSCLSCKQTGILAPELLEILRNAH